MCGSDYFYFSMRTSVCAFGDSVGTGVCADMFVCWMLMATVLV